MLHGITLHARLIKSCNADCVYCSSWQNSDKKIHFMNKDDFIKSLTFIIENIFLKNDLIKKNTSINIQYVGGEILLIPINELRDIVYSAREYLSKYFVSVIDGVQSNLIFSEKKILEIDTLFSGNIGTSVDNFSDKRVINGNSKKYKEILNRSRNLLKNRRKRSIGSVFVYDNDSYINLIKEIDIASEKKYTLVIRPLFIGGKNKLILDSDLFNKTFVSAFEKWFMKSNIIVEPYFSLLKRVIFFKEHNIQLNSFCAFQKNCADVSINIDPDGSLFLCNEMADSKNYCFGNSLKGIFDEDTWFKLRDRKNNISKKCLSCKYFQYCQGGCMNEAIQQNNTLYGVTEYCSVWLSLFDKMFELINNYDNNKILEWIKSIENE